ncbi:MAG: DUF4114 domain-containing protein [Lewinellaceae bacterium]|nr:DUF4114 domain-containing protein [Lewinellaceae bacterium]
MRIWPTANLLIFMGLCFLFFTCKKDTSFQTTDELQVKNVGDHLSFLEHEEGIPDRIHLINRPLILSDTSLGRSNCPKEALWAQVAEITTLHLNGQNMSATHVALAGDLALVTYHLRGNDHMGAIEVVDLKNPDKPKVTEQIIFLQADVNAIAIQATAQGNNRKVWLALSDEKNGAVLGELLLQNKKFKNNYYREVKLAYLVQGAISSSANAVAEAGNFIYVAAGRTNGGVFCFHSNDLSLAGIKQFSEAKGIATNGVQVASLKATESAQVLLGAAGSTSFPTSYPIGSVVHQNVEDELGGKVSLFFSHDNPDYLFVTAGKSGLKVVDISTGLTKFSSPDKMLKSGNTNGITLNGNYAYVANGADGLAIFEIGNDDLPDADHIFFWDLDEPGASANFVESGDDWVFVAKGEGGFKILKKPVPSDIHALCSYDDGGKPTCLAPDQDICAALATHLNAAIPVNGNVPSMHPLYMNNGAPDILLTKSTRVSLTFLEENTSLLHSIGYYAYPADCEPSSAEELVGLVAFPNCSSQGPVPILTPGNTIELHANFKANTKIGFFLVPKGWTSSSSNIGQTLLYTNPKFNQKAFKQGLVFYDALCDAVVVSFEEKELPTSQADFRDVVFQINFAESQAFEDHDLIPL